MYDGKHNGEIRLEILDTKNQGKKRKRSAKTEEMYKCTIQLTLPNGEEFSDESSLKGINRLIKPIREVIKYRDTIAPKRSYTSIITEGLSGTVQKVLPCYYLINPFDKYYNEDFALFQPISNSSSSSSSSKSTAEIFKAAHVRAGVPPRISTTASGKKKRRHKEWPTEKDIKELAKNNFYMMAGAPVSDNSQLIICSSESTSLASKGYATFVKTRLMSYATNSANTKTVLTKMGKLEKYGCTEKLKKFTFRQGLSFLIGQPRNNSTTFYTKEDIETVINIGKGLASGDLILQNKWLNGRHCSVVGNRFIKKLLIELQVPITHASIQKIDALYETEKRAGQHLSDDTINTHYLTLFEDYREMEPAYGKSMYKKMLYAGKADTYPEEKDGEYTVRSTIIQTPGRSSEDLAIRCGDVRRCDMNEQMVMIEICEYMRMFMQFSKDYKGRDGFESVDKYIEEIMTMPSTRSGTSSSGASSQ